MKLLFDSVLVFLGTLIAAVVFAMGEPPAATGLEASATASESPVTLGLPDTTVDLN